MPDENVRDFELLRNTMVNLVKLSSTQWWKQRDLDYNKLTESTWENFKNLVDLPVRPVTLAELRGEFKKGAETLSVNIKRVYLPPLRRKQHFVPLLSIECDFAKKPPLLNLRVGMYYFVKGSKADPHGLGFRFEMGDPEHNYCHVQLIGASYAGKSTEKLPERVPCIPTAALCPVSLLICMIISFYGVNVWNKFFADVSIKDRHKTLLKCIL